MAHNDAIEVLFTERNKLINERDAMLQKFSTLIMGIESSIEVLSGKKVWEIAPETIYFDTNPDYIRGTEDGV